MYETHARQHELSKMAAQPAKMWERCGKPFFSHFTAFYSSQSYSTTHFWKELTVVNVLNKYLYKLGVKNAEISIAKYHLKIVMWSVEKSETLRGRNIILWMVFFWLGYKTRNNMLKLKLFRLVSFVLLIRYLWFFVQCEYNDLLVEMSRLLHSIGYIVLEVWYLWFTDVWCKQS